MMRLSAIGCWGGSPRVGGACAGYLVECGRDAVLLDCGPGVCATLPRARALTDVDEVVVSHAHYDHVSDAGALMYARLVHRQLGMTTRDLTFHAPAACGRDELARLAMPGASRVIGVEAGDEVRVGGLRVATRLTSHPVPCLALRVSDETGATLGYTADGALTDDLASFLAGVDVLVTECSLYPGHDGRAMGHMSCDDVIELQRASRPAHLLLTHLPIYGDPAEMLSRVRGAVTGATVDIACPAASHGISDIGPRAAAREVRGIVTMDVAAAGAPA